MAIYNEILAARFSKALQKIFSMKGPQAAKQLSGEISPALPLFYGAEARSLESWYRFSATFAFGASAANLNQLRLRNPSNSGVVVVVEKITIVNPGTAADQFAASNGPATTDLTNVFPVGNTRFDPRGQPQSPMIFSNVQQAAQANLNIIFWYGALPIGGMIDVIQTDIQEFPILPGDGLHLRNGTVNNATFMVIWWRERVMEESERQ